MLRHLRANPWLRAGLVAIAVGFAGYGLASEWPQVQDALHRLAWYDVLGAQCAALAGLGCMMLAWRTLLAGLGSPLTRPTATRVMFIGQLGKYLPGALWALAAQVELARDYDVPRRRSVTATLVSMAITLAVGLIMAAVTLPLTSANAARHYWWVLACTPLILVGLYPPVTRLGLDLVLRIARRPPLEKPVSLPGMARALAWTTTGWLLYGLHSWLLVSDVARDSTRVLLMSMGAYALAWAAGFLIVVFPGGIGPRELALIAALAPVMPRAAALVIALVSRVVMTIGDLAWAGLGFAIGRRAVPTGQGHTAHPGRRPSAAPDPVPGSPNATGQPPLAR